MQNAKSILKRTLLYCIVLFAYSLVMTVTGIHCPISYITGIKCPACGVSRAMLALFSLDFRAYAEYNCMALPLILAAWLLINEEFFKHKRIVRTLAFTVLILNLALYLFNLIAK